LTVTFSKDRYDRDFAILESDIEKANAAVENK
jgi:hypothetical protein